MITVNVGGYSSVYRANVTGIGISDLIITGSASSEPGKDISPAPGTIYEYVDLLPARYASIQESVISASLPMSWLSGHNLAPQDVVIYHLSGSAWNALPTSLVISDSGRAYYTALSPGFGRFAITGDFRESVAPPVIDQTKTRGTFGDMVEASVPVTTVSHTPVVTQTTEIPAQPATLPSAGFSSLTIVAAIFGIMILIGLVLVARRRKSDL
jgi:LPXTG-motif cell wall-anchored protein